MVFHSFFQIHEKFSFAVSHFGTPITELCLESLSKGGLYEFFHLHFNTSLYLRTLGISGIVCCPVFRLDLSLIGCFVLDIDYSTGYHNHLCHNI